MKRSEVRLAVSMGCPSGIGPEVSVAAAARLLDRARDHVRVLLVGDLGALRAAAGIVGVDRARLVKVPHAPKAFTLASCMIPVLEPGAALAARDRMPGAPSRRAGRAQLEYIDVATDLVAGEHADALVTGPVSKDAISRSGAPGARGFLGHTEYLAARLGAKEVVMAFWSEALTTSLVTTHLPLSAVPKAITKEGVACATYWTAWLIRRLVAPGTRPVVAVAALNPHAGEHGLIGCEETAAIGSGIVLARKRLARASIDVVIRGPVAAESAFRLGASGVYNAVVAMYHDQATIPMKLLSFGEAVNVSLGLPIVRTSVDHGTAYDRAGKGTADPRGMLQAMRLAARLVRAGKQS
ncbi:MAG: 4-hydroxythreonine-4-phosphate dehydrogenase PdxA [Polyangiaceae bacterium]|nr:4-hydroxythreonine-4-phosphate dehydrogenase PdxA [Polyangiaceae bacterium]